MSDDYEPAIGEVGPESPTGEDAPAESADDGDTFESGAPSGLVIPRRGHVISDKVRELFKTAATSVKEQLASGEDDDYEPAIDNPEPVTPAPAAGGPQGSDGVPSPSVGTPAAAPAPSLDPAVLAKVSQLDARTAELDAREKALTDRQAAIESGDLGRLRDVFYDKGGAHAVVELVKMWTGAATDAELQDEVADLITELSGHSLGVTVPTEIRARLDSKRALKSVKATQAKLDKREQEIQQRAAKQAEQDNIQRAITALDTEVRKPELAAQFPFLITEPNAGELIFETVDAQFKRDGTEMKWVEAAKRVNDYLETKWREAYGKRAHLFTASPAPAGGATNGQGQRPQGDPQGIRRSHTLTNAQAASAPTKPPSPSQPTMRNGKWSAEDHRANTKRRMREAFKPPTE